MSRFKRVSETPPAYGGRGGLTSEADMRMASIARCVLGKAGESLAALVVNTLFGLLALIDLY